jgi:hypothetical protein
MSAAFICAFASITNETRPRAFCYFHQYDLACRMVHCVPRRHNDRRQRHSTTHRPPDLAYFASLSFARFIATSPSCELRCAKTQARTMRTSRRSRQSHARSETCSEHVFFWELWTKKNAKGKREGGENTPNALCVGTRHANMHVIHGAPYTEGFEVYERYLHLRFCFHHKRFASRAFCYFYQ